MIAMEGRKPVLDAESEAIRKAAGRPSRLPTRHLPRHVPRPLSRERGTGSRRSWEAGTAQPLRSRYAMRDGTAGGGILSRHSAHEALDEDDVRVRPGRGTRPRTRRRPAHEDAPEGFVVSTERGRYGTLTEGRVVIAMKARELGHRSVVVGDRVVLAGDTSGDEGTLARIVRVQPRTSALRRSPDDTDPVERVIVANAQQLVIVCALAQPAPTSGSSTGAWSPRTTPASARCYA